MRLNLCEIAFSLGCGPSTIVWEEPLCCMEPAAPQTAYIKTAGRPVESVVLPQTYETDSMYWCEAEWTKKIPRGAQIDSRQVEPGMIFICLPGEKVDGHDYALEAAKAGAIAIVASRNPFRSEKSDKERLDRELPPVFLVEDTREALWRLAVCHRDTSLAKVVGITGSAGKTSVKEVLAQVLSMHGKTERNPMNLNNQIGLPLSILNCDADASFWVLEAGISEEHDMRELAAILRPDVAVILNVGDAHMVGLGEKGVAACKTEIFDYIQPGGTAIACADYQDLKIECLKRRADFAYKNIDYLEFSRSNSAVYCMAEYEGKATDTYGNYKVHFHQNEISITAPFRGDFGSENVAAIFAAATKLGLATDEIISGLAKAVLPGQRFNCRHFGDFMIVDDSYNANPLSAKRMVEAVATMAEEAGVPLYLIMGEMLELGTKAAESHEELGSCMAAVKPDLVFWKGGHAAEVQQGLQKAGYSKAFYPLLGGQDFSLLLEELDLKKGLLFFKGSRGNKLERLVDICIEMITKSSEKDVL